jgi:hypothetical protein
MGALMRYLISFALVLFAFAVKAGEEDIVSAVKATRAEMIRILSKEPNDWEHAKFVNNIDNYNIGISESEKQVIVVYALKKSQVRILGGRVDFVVSKNPFVIEKTVRHK